MEVFADKGQVERGPSPPSSVAYLFEEFFEITPVLLQNIGEQFCSVGVMEYYVDPCCQVLVRKLNIGRLLNPELLPEQLVEGFVLEG